MMKQEFEALAGRTVTTEQYKMIEALYMESDLNKQDFVKSIKGMLKSIPEKKNRTILTMAIHNAYGDMKTPNGCYYLTVKVELVDVSIRTGYRTVKVIPNSFELTYSYNLTDWDENLIIDDNGIGRY